MTPRLVDARPLEGYRVWLRFSDGTEGAVDLEGELWGEVFEPLKDVGKFRELRVHPELQTLVWPSGADFAPEFLYEKLRPNTSLNPDAQKARAG
ncbi:MAG: DUF2442 domain-containing protein [Gammaproteobacteria bacterium]|nr:DUF2442 domain-containing protein [Gammaproteobacteria bacterium]